MEPYFKEWTPGKKLMMTSLNLTVVLMFFKKFKYILFPVVINQ